MPSFPPTTTPAAPPAARWATAASLALIVVAAGLAWSNTLHAPFIFDDRAAILDNPSIHNLSALGEVISPPADGRAVGGRPVVNFSLALNYQWSGTDPWSYHVFNLAVHALAGLVLFGLIRRTINGAAAPPTRLAVPGLALAIALLWTVHPLQTESVTCIVQRTESLCGLFYLVVLYGLVRSATSRHAVAWLTVSVSAAWLGMGTKEVMVTAPVLALLYDRTFLAGTLAEAWRRRRGYYAALASGWLLLLALLCLGGGTRGTAAGFGVGVSPWSYLLQQCEAMVLYLKLAVWPHPLVLDYGTVVPGSLVDVVWPAGVVLALLAATIWALVRRPAAGFLGAAFFLILAPSSSVVPLAAQTMAEHRMYLPLAAVIAAAVTGACALGGRWVLAGFFLAAGVAGGMTWQRNEVYRSEISLWSDTVAKAPTNPRARINLGAALMEAGQVAPAVAQFERAQQLQPNSPEAHANLCHAYTRLGRFDEAVAQGEAALQLAPGHRDATANLAEALYGWGNGRAAARDFGAAIAAYRRSVVLVPTYAPARNNLANALLVTGEVDAAIAAYREVLRLRPNDASVRANLNQALALKAGR